MTAAPQSPPPKGKCPICKKEATVKYRPFCSSRCADVDLHRWLKESYSLPGEPASPTDINDDE